MTSTSKSNLRCRIGACLMFLAACVAQQGAAAAAERQAPHAYHFIIGAKAAFLEGYAHGHAAPHGGAGVFFEVEVLHDWLELELGARAMNIEHGFMLPIDVLAKKPFHLSETIHPFIGAGPTMVPAFGDASAVYFGVAVVAGSYFWILPTVGLLAEANYNLISEHGALHEIGADIGLGYRW